MLATTPKPRRVEKALITPVTLANMPASSSATRIAQPASVSCSLRSAPESTAPRNSRTIGVIRKTSTAAVSALHRIRAYVDDAAAGQVEHDRAVAEIAREQDRRLGGREDAEQDLRLAGVRRVADRQFAELVNTMIATMMTAGSRFRASRMNGSNFDLPDRPMPKALRRPVRNSAVAICPSPRRGPS